MNRPVRTRSGPTLTDTAYVHIERMIIHGEIEPLTFVSEADFMEWTGLGRTPVREAVHRLARERMVEIHPSRGILIPEISVDASIEGVGILANGELGTPASNPWTATGWYKGGPLPGEKGSSVIDGHLDRPGCYPAVFWLLRNLHTGSNVQVILTDGTKRNFRVTEVDYYQPQQAPLQLIFGNNGGKYLNLITCAGDWIPDEHQTTQRLVIYTTLVE